MNAGRNHAEIILATLQCDPGEHAEPDCVAAWLTATRRLLIGFNHDSRLVDRCVYLRYASMRPSTLRDLRAGVVRSLRAELGRIVGAASRDLAEHGGIILDEASRAFLERAEHVLEAPRREAVRA